MDALSFDAVTRQSANGALRRGSLFTLGATGLLAVLGGSQTVEAKRNGRKKKHKKNQNQQAPQECPPQAVNRCPGEVQPCIDALTVACGGDTVACAPALACCSRFETCDVGGFFTCLLASGV
jgi:hypothetical protein